MGEIIGGRWEVQELVAAGWNGDLAARFPDADHAGCRQMMYHEHGGWHPYDPPKCLDWHCNRCGAPTNSFGHHDCLDRPA